MNEKLLNKDKEVLNNLPKVPKFKLDFVPKFEALVMVNKELRALPKLIKLSNAPTIIIGNLDK